MQEGFRQSLEALYRRSQRESNAHASYGYAQLLMSLIQEWRALFKRPELLFIFAQLPNCTLEPDCDWPRLRDKQRRALTLRNTAMVVTIGYGEDNDLHPLDKRHVAQRLATAAESLVYGRDCEPMGPLPVMAIHKDDGIEISFIHTGGGLVCTGDVPFDILEPGGSIYRVKACRYDCHGGHGTGRASGAVRELSQYSVSLSANEASMITLLPGTA